MKPLLCKGRCLPEGQTEGLLWQWLRFLSKMINNGSIVIDKTEQVMILCKQGGVTNENN